MYGKTNRRGKYLALIICIAALAAVAAGVYFIASRLEVANEPAPSGAGTVVTRIDDEETEDIPTIYVDGKPYVYNRDLCCLLVLGIDDAELIESDTYRNRSQADLVLLAVFDPTVDSCSLLQLNRDTILEVPVPDAAGNVTGYRSEQLALAHTYGSGMEDSCRNTVKAVSRYLYGIGIDNYFALTMDAIPVLNDLVGGVTVPVEDDFSAVDPSLKKGTEVKLTAQNVENYVRARRGMDDQTNVNRMARQRHFLNGLADGLKASISEDASFVVDAYAELSSSLVTDCSLEELSTYADQFVSYRLSDTVTPPGETARGAQFVEFYADEDALRQLVLDLFYIPAQ